MTDKPEWIAEGWHAFREEVAAKHWPESPALHLLIELAFFGGANWIMMILDEEGIEPPVLDRIQKELRSHRDHVETRNLALQAEVAAKATKQ